MFIHSFVELCVADNDKYEVAAHRDALRTSAALIAVSCLRSSPASVRWYRFYPQCPCI